MIWVIRPVVVVAATTPELSAVKVMCIDAPRACTEPR
jgi:hypothetical protein